MPTLRDSTIYDNIVNKKYIQQARDYLGGNVKAMIDVTIISASANGDTYNCNVLPANVEVIDAFLITDGLGGSVTITLGDSGAAARYIASVSFATAELSAKLAMAGMRYRPVLDTILVLTIGGAAATVGKKVKGWVEYCPGE